jgi:hypothetical protein
MRKTRKLLFTSAVAFAAFACRDIVDPVMPDIAPSYGVVSACVAVAGTIQEGFAGADFPNNVFYFSGPVSGSLVGTSLAALTGSNNPAGDPPSPVVFGAGTRTLSVTGGSVDALAGKTLVFELEQTSVQGDLSVRGSDRMTLVSGARRGHLTVHGQFDFTTYTLTATYHGSICP